MVRGRLRALREDHPDIPDVRDSITVLEVAEAALSASDEPEDVGERVDKSAWYWGGYAGHLSVGNYCRFHLSTLLPNGYHVSTVGDYWPRHKDGRDTIGAGPDDFFETFVFKAHGMDDNLNIIHGDMIELEGVRYADSRDAERGHHAMCEQYALLPQSDGGEADG